ncbi:MAG: SDR family oxidoreductase [Lentisphaeria bacterium]|nr:SDR family oxidoreductase [Lentisphaeria bacterium]
MKSFVKDKVVVITGGSSGFGLESARLLLELGSKVVITGRNLEKLKKAEVELNSENLLVVQADATVTTDWQVLVKQVLEKFGRLDVLVNNHGAGGKIDSLEEMTDEDIDQTLNVNLSSVIRGCREVLSVMKKQQSGHIINVSSVCARYSFPTWSVYTAAKAGLVGFTKCVHLEMVTWGGKATTVIPGGAQTGFCAAANIDSEWMVGYPTAEDFARTLVHCIDVPPSTVIQDVTVWGNKQIADMMNPF